MPSSQKKADILFRKGEKSQLPSVHIQGKSFRVIITFSTSPDHRECAPSEKHSSGRIQKMEKLRRNISAVLATVTHEDSIGYIRQVYTYKHNVLAVQHYCWMVRNDRND